MGDALVNQLVENGLVKNIADIYDLTEEKLLALEHMGTKSAQNILFEIENSKKLPLARHLWAGHSYGRRAHRPIPSRAFRFDG